ncbi:hypothetical protein BS46_gp45 [Acinetobacter phage BS46]|nr:hypothetical protein BS46_gp45 [Acinetobacter phage BS46]
MLALLPYYCTFIAFFASIVFTVLLVKYIMLEYFERVRRISKLRRKNKNENEL